MLEIKQRPVPLTIRELLMRYLQKERIFENAILSLFKILLLKAGGNILSDMRFIRDSSNKEIEEKKLYLLATLLGIEIEVVQIEKIERKPVASIRIFCKEFIDELILSGFRMKPFQGKAIVSLLKLKDSYCCIYKKGYIGNFQLIQTMDEEFKQFYEMVLLWFLIS